LARRGRPRNSDNTVEIAKKKTGSEERGESKPNENKQNESKSDGKDSGGDSESGRPGLRSSSGKKKA